MKRKILKKKKVNPYMNFEHRKYSLNEIGFSNDR